MNEKEVTIGVLGGMGTFATIHVFKQYADIFQAKKEWERPRIVIDNRCTMPSRVKAFLYEKDVDILLTEMIDSLKHLIDSGCTKIILACNTSHLFLPQIYEQFPEAQEYILNIIDVCIQKIAEDNISNIYLLASEGTITSKIYQAGLSKIGVHCDTPKENEYDSLRKCIESVKQNQYALDTEETFVKLINRYDYCILGCTELPILYEKYHNRVKCLQIYDPLYLALKRIREEYYQ